MHSSITPLRLAYGTDTFQFGDLFLPEGKAPYPVVILIHGGYWRAHFGLDLMHGLAEDLVGRGMAVWNIEYRRVGNPGGGWPGTFLDVAQAADFLLTIAASYGLDLDKAIVVGHSSGGHLACWLAARSHLPAESLIAPHKSPLQLLGVISLAGVLDLMQAYTLHLSNNAVVELLGTTPDKAPERYAATSPISLLPLGLAQILIHGTADKHVPLQISRAYAAAAQAAGDPVSYLEPAGVDHFDLIHPTTDIWKITVAELEGML